MLKWTKKVQKKWNKQDMVVVDDDCGARTAFGGHLVKGSQVLVRNFWDHEATNMRQH